MKPTPIFMTKFLLKNSPVPALLFFLSVFAFSCTDMDKTLGEDFIPESQELKVQVFDAGGFFAMQTVMLDSLSTGNFSTGTLGRLTDVRLGKTTAGFATQLIPYSYSSDLGYQSGPALDSVFLHLGFTSTFGSDKTPMSVEVYELASALSDTTTFYGGDTAFVNSMVGSVKIGEGIVTADSVGVTIRLSNSNDLYTRLFNISTAENFAENFNGLYVKVADGSGGCIKSVSLVNTTNAYATSALVGFYHYNDTINEAPDSVKRIIYDVSSTTPRFNTFSHDYSGTTVLQPNNPVLYMQGLGGVALQMSFDQSAVQAWLGDKHYAVNRAELLLPVEDYANPNELDKLYSTQLYCMTKEPKGYAYTRDVFSYTGAFNGSFDGAINRSQMCYTLNITHFFNDVLLKGKTTPMLIVPYAYMSDARSALVSNSPASNRKPQLKITYGEVK